MNMWKGILVAVGFGCLLPTMLFAHCYIKGTMPAGGSASGGAYRGAPGSAGGAPGSAGGAYGSAGGPPLKECPARCDGCPNVKKATDEYKGLAGDAKKKLDGGAKAMEGGAKRQFGGNGQAPGVRATSRGYSGLGNKAGSVARQFEQFASQIAQKQQEIAQESFTQNPGQTHHEAQEFYRRTESGKSMYSNYYEEATHPIVKDQAAAYDDLGDIRGAAEEDAKKYREREKEFNDLAAKQEKNAEKLGSADPSGDGSIAPTPDSPGSENGLLAANPGVKEAAKPANSSEKIGTGGPDGGGLAGKGLSSEAGKLSDISTGKGAKQSATEFSEGGAGSSGKGLMSREALREMLMRDKGKGRVAKADGEDGGLDGVAGGSADGKTVADSKDAKDKNSNAKAPSTEIKEEDLPTFGDRGLGKQQLALDGSKTEASVKSMLASLSGDGGRQLASNQDDASIGSQDGPTLFERCHAMHKRCEKNGCVRLAVQSGTGG